MASSHPPSGVLQTGVAEGSSSACILVLHALAALSIPSCSVACRCPRDPSHHVEDGWLVGCLGDCKQPSTHSYVIIEANGTVKKGIAIKIYSMFSATARSRARL